MDENYSAGMIDKTLMDTKLTHRKKCVGEYNDLYHIFHPNNNEKYLRNIKENKKIYMNYKGVFTHMYDAANRNGNIIELFKNTNCNRNKDKEEKNKGNSNSSLKSTWANNSNRIKNAREFAKNLLKGLKDTNMNVTMNMTMKIKKEDDDFFSTVK